MGSENGLVVKIMLSIFFLKPYHYTHFIILRYVNIGCGHLIISSKLPKGDLNPLG
jgi:hypothetical protein